VPGRNWGSGSGSVLAWVAHLNRWAAGEVRAFRADPFTGKNSRARAGHALVEYALDWAGGSGGARSVLPAGGSAAAALPVSEAVHSQLVESGVAVVVGGWDGGGGSGGPGGPAIRRTGGVVTVRAGGEGTHAGGGWEVMVWRDGRVETRAELGGGKSVVGRACAPGSQESRAGDELVGRQLADGRWVTGRVVGGSGPEASFVVVGGAARPCRDAEAAAAGAADVVRPPTPWAPGASAAALSGGAMQGGPCAAELSLAALHALGFAEHAGRARSDNLHALGAAEARAVAAIVQRIAGDPRRSWLLCGFPTSRAQVRHPPRPPPRPP
jgi:hypothetical protein